MSYKTAKKFWRNIDRYPDYPHLLRRRFLDLNFILGHIERAESLLDIGCADCSMLILLRELTPLKRLYGVDISTKIMRSQPDIFLSVLDVTKDVSFPKADITISFGMFPYIFNKLHLKKIISNIESDIFLVRAPCTSKSEDEYIDKFSRELNANYSAIYRTASSYVSMLADYFKYVKVDRAYPDEIEGKYDTKHFYFVCRKGK